jgi:HPt (histidine-containing phosphotransfer) domain-containing protein
MDFSELAGNLGLEEDEYLELIKLLIETSRADLEGIEASIREQDSDEVANRLHSIKGATGNLGLMEIYDLAKQGEQIARDNAMDQLSDIVQGLKTRLNSLAEAAGI